MGKLENQRIIIDTDILIDLLRNRKETSNFIQKLESQKTLLATTSINAFELHYGAHKSNQPQQGLKATKQLLSRLIMFPLTLKSAQKAGHIYAKLETRGQPIGLRDTFIAAIAITKECSLATKNTTHFSKIENLRIITSQWNQPTNSHSQSITSNQTKAKTGKQPKTSRQPKKMTCTENF